MQLRVHPRIRGEYAAVESRGSLDPGSPPHTRGIHDETTPHLTAVGFTPAYAGNTLLHRADLVCIWVHPRIRGEYRNAEEAMTRAKGSPPHTRGIQRREGRAPHTPRFTPAYAGNTLDQPSAVHHTRVHPRIRGEYSVSSKSAILIRGSPPHTRGILVVVSFDESCFGFTPAYAGNTPEP